jgi:hypothetical protein
MSRASAREAVEIYIARGLTSSPMKRNNRMTSSEQV